MRQDDATDDDLLNKTQAVPEDIDVQPIEGLRGYQDDLDTDPHRQDTVQYEQAKKNGNDPADFMQMPRNVIEDELDSMASDEQQDTGNDDYIAPEGTSDDLRENIEDLDEDDKDDR